MKTKDQLSLLIVATLANFTIFHNIPASIVFVASVTFVGFISYITKVKDKRIEEMQAEIKDMKERMTSVSVSIGMRK